MSLKDSEKVNQALNELGITEYVIDGVPTNESEFNSMFKKVTSVSNGQAVLSSNPSDFGVTWDEVKAKIDAKTNYQQERKYAFGDNLDDMIIALWEKVIESNDSPAAAIQTARQVVKDANPKP